MAKKILIIDDNMEDRDLIITHIKKSTKIKKERIITEESNCLKDAISKIDTKNYDVIILDLTLPESKGIETVKTITDHLQKINKNIPINDNIIVYLSLLSSPPPGFGLLGCGCLKIEKFVII